MSFRRIMRTTKMRLDSNQFYWSDTAAQASNYFIGINIPGSGLFLIVRLMEIILADRNLTAVAALG